MTKDVCKLFDSERRYVPDGKLPKSRSDPTKSLVTSAPTEGDGLSICYRLLSGRAILS